MVRFNINLPERLYQGIKDLSEQTQLNSSEIIRRVLDYSIKEERLNEAFPQLSGSIKARELV